MPPGIYLYFTLPYYKFYIYLISSPIYILHRAIPPPPPTTLHRRREAPGRCSVDSLIRCCTATLQRVLLLRGGRAAEEVGADGKKEDEAREGRERLCEPRGEVEVGAGGRRAGVGGRGQGVVVGVGGVGVGVGRWAEGIAGEEGGALLCVVRGVWW